MSKICSSCGFHEYYARGLCKRCYMLQYHKDNTEKHMAATMRWQKRNPNKMKIYKDRTSRNSGHAPMSENKSCASFLGIMLPSEY